MTQDPSRTGTLGRRVWTAIGIILLVIGLVLLASQVNVILTAVILALFPAALLDPLAIRLRRTRLPNSLVALLLILALLAGIGAILAFVTIALINQWEQIAESVVSGLQQLDQAIDWNALPGDFQGVSDVASRAGSALMEGGGGALAAGAGTVGNIGTAAVLLVVALFFYFKDGSRIWEGIAQFVPSRYKDRVDLLGAQAFWTVGAYFRAQLLVALIDAVLIGIGLWILGVPLVLPLAALIFLGGLFPIVGAIVAGAIAVVVALADQGPVIALITLAIVIGVQQLESNILEPIIHRRVIQLHPLVIILAITAGGVTMGILGAFLAVPVAAVIGRVVDYFSGRPFPSGPGSEQKDDDGGGAGEEADVGAQPAEEATEPPS